MFDAQRIAHITKASKAEWWPYPRTFESLKEAGVVTHEVWVEEFHSCYKNKSKEWIEPTPEGFRSLKAAEYFDEKALMEGLERRIRKETTYVEFLQDIAAAGVVYYIVDMNARTVTYWGKGDKESYVQHVPVLKNK